MPNVSRISVLLFLVVLTSCGRPLPTMDGMNLSNWKNDRNGCLGTRAAVIRPLVDQKNKLQGLSEMQVIDLLGRPDQNELYKRNQKFYYYLLEPGKQCGRLNQARKLSVRFTAMGVAKEIAVE
jgi:hypothetical protein